MSIALRLLGEERNLHTVLPKGMKRAIHVLFLIWIFTVVVVSETQAATLEVCSSSCPYSTIQAAVDVAASGDTIEIGPGTYVEVVQVNTSNLRFVGAGSADTIVDGPLSAFVFHEEAGDVTLSGVTLHSQVTGSCIRNHAVLTVQDSVLENCFNDENGGGIYTSGDLVLDGVRILFGIARYSQNSPGQGRGGGLYVDGNSTSGRPIVRIYNSVFAANEALFGGGVYIGTGAKVFIDKTAFSSNRAMDTTGLYSATGRGGAIRTFGELHVTNGTFYDNSADLFGGAIAVNCGSAPVKIVNSVIFENYTNFTGLIESGGGLYVEAGGDVKVIGTEFHSNHSGYGGGVGVYNLGLSGTVNIIQSSFVSNRALENGGGLWVYGADVTVNTSTVALNLAEGDGGGAYGSAASGTTTFRNSTIVDNIALGSGGGLDSSSMAMRNSILARNNAGGSSDDCGGFFDTLNHNLIGNDDGCSFTPLTNDVNGTAVALLDPLLGPLTDSDGRLEAGTYTHVYVPLAGSPAVNAGALQCGDLDQNGSRRPQTFLLGPCERGSAELNASCGSPVKPVTIEPANNAINVENQPLLIWEPTAGAATFDVTLASQPPPFTGGIVAQTFGITATHWMPEVTLDPNQTYYWRVKAYSLCGGRAQSNAFTFSTS